MADSYREWLLNKIRVKCWSIIHKIRFFFREHDFNNDTKLDGLEILAAIKHSDMAHEASSKTANLTGEALKIANAEELREYSGLCLKY